MKKCYPLLSLCLLANSLISANAATPETPPKVLFAVQDDNRYFIVYGPKSNTNAERMAFLQANGLMSNKKLWVVPLYQVNDITASGKKGRDVFVTSLSIQDKTLLIQTTTARRLSVNLLTHQVTHLRR